MLVKKIVLALAAALMLAVMVAAPVMASEADFDGLNQDADSGSVDQSLSIGGGNDNSNICVAPQLAANTGNAQNSLDLGAQPNDENTLAEDLLDDADLDELSNRQFDNLLDLVDDFGNQDNLDDSGDLLISSDSSIEVSPSNTTSCDQSVDQTATATG